MPTFISGLPLHVLVVHAVVVLVPLAVLGTIVVAVWPAARRRYGWLVVGVTLVATAAIPIATDSGENLRDRLERSALIHAHAQLGDQLFLLVLPLLVVSAGMMGLELYRKRRAATSTAPGSGTATDSTATDSTATDSTATVVAAPGWIRATGIVLSAAVVVFAVLSGVQVVRIGDSGARAAWGDATYVSQPAQHGG
jgi:hypothetical protein